MRYVQRVSGGVQAGAAHLQPCTHADLMGFQPSVLACSVFDTDRYFDTFTSRFPAKPSPPEDRQSRIWPGLDRIRQFQPTNQKLNLSANWPCLPPLAEVTLPKLNGSLTLEAGAPKICRLKALNISKRSSMFISSRM